MSKVLQPLISIMIVGTLTIMLCSCAANRAKLSQQAQLEKEISRWQSFHMEGMAEINVNSFVIRKYFVCQKYSHSLQFDLVNSGLLGAEPAPLVHIQVDSMMTIDSPYKDMIQAMFKRTGLKQMDLSRYLDFKTIFNDKTSEIINTGKTTLGSYDFQFKKNMQLEQIVSHDQKQTITFEYRHGAPSLIIADITKLAKIRMQVEQFVDTSCCDSLTNLPDNDR